MKEHESNKPNHPTLDPYFIEAEKNMAPTFTGNPEGSIPTAIFGGERVITISALAPAIILFKLYGWPGLAAVLAALGILLVSLRLIRKAIAAPSMEPGYINKYRQMTVECISPNEKKLSDKYYRLKCTDCGRIHHAYAPQIRRTHCPYCRRK